MNVGKLPTVLRRSVTERSVRRWLTFLLIVCLSWVDGRSLLAAQSASLVVIKGAYQGSWEALLRRVSRLNLPYRVVAVEELSAERLREAKLLFLPNVGKLTRDQIDMVQQWVLAGGRVIASGPIEAASDGQEALKLLLGGAWVELRPAPLRPEPSADQVWTKRGNVLSAVQGGVLQRSEAADTAVAATWAGSAGEPAILSTPASIYFGWQWGSGPPAFDRDWLAAAIERFVPGSLGRYQIAPVEGTAMSKELEGLLSRVESALLTSNARAATPNQFKEYREAAVHARETLKALPALLSNGRDDEARAQWENAIEELWANYPTSSLAALPEVRAIWLDRGTVVAAGSEQNLAQIFDRLAKAGINTVFLETVNAGYPIFPSTVAPAVNPLVSGWDPLASAVRLAHERKMELHAWVWVFAIGNTRHNLLIGRPADFPGPVLAQHPEWAQMDRKGNRRPLGQPEYWLDPLNPEVRTYLSNLFTEIAERYDVDGLQLDYIRYPSQKSPAQQFGFGTAARSRFQQLTGVDPLVLSPQTDRSLWQLWNRFRADAVTSFTEEISTSLRAKKPNLVLSAAVWPQPNFDRMRELQQDWETWARNGTVDLLVPMTYALNTRRLQQLVEPVLDSVKDTPVLFLPSLNLMSLPQVQLRDQLQAIRDLPSGGYSLFATAHLAEDQQQMLGQAASTSKLIPFRDPVSTAIERFAALKTEWAFLISNQQLWLPEYQLGAWRNQTSRTQAALETLSKNPSAGWLSTARQELEHSRKGLGDWFGVERSLRPYRVQTWDNRLVALENLLRYAEARLGRLAKSGAWTTGRQ